MQWTEIVVTLAGVIATLGGWEAVRYLIDRKSNMRKSRAEADTVENAAVVTAYKDEIAAAAEQFNLLKDTNVFLQQQLKEKEERFAEQTEQVRKLNKDLLTLTNDYAKLALKEQTYHCDVKGCPNRQPPNGY